MKSQPSSSAWKLWFGINLIFSVVASAGAADSNGWHIAQAPLMTRWAAEVNPTNALPE